MNVKQTLTDTGYVVVGFGVIGVEQADAARREVAIKVGDAMTPVRDQLDGRTEKARASAAATLEASRRRVRSSTDSFAAGFPDSERATAIARDVVVWLDELVEDFRAQVNPIVERLPEPARRVNDSWTGMVDRGRSRALDLLGAADSATASADTATTPANATTTTADAA